MNNTPRNLDDHDPSEWGNVELPGLSDEQLHSKNWNKITAARETVKTREKNGWKEKNEQRLQDPEYVKRWSGSIKKAYEDPELRKLQSDIHKGVAKTKEHAENIRQARLSAPPRGQATRDKISQSQIGNTKHCKPVLTPEGVFASLKEAGRHYSTIGLGNAVAHLRKRIREQWDGYKHISKEEYILLTGKEL